ncbi:hypothetical protein LZF95_25070 [Algoriphagus sp. AGSA1]|uniref:hypothetical protein n=1 Tax=Algoriphagus sp. AGSA1 TaxID=2907213 RepID=UPI001F26EDFE|nr:hypothetical protein [Algoriphagus sp. AGSA1]MCE7057981.1 hypothetical protein [Algoriphagus sp. AGSA1]
MEEKPIPRSVKKRLDGWFITFWAFTICHYLFGIGGVLASTIAASYDDNDVSRTCGTIAAVCIAFVGFVKPDDKYRKHVIAWRILDEKVNLYRFGLIELNDLVEGMNLAEKTLDQLEREVGKSK